MNQNRLRKTKYIIPGIFTLANMAFGFYSIIAAIEGKWNVAGALLTIAVLMDGLDGKVARYTNATSEFGVNFDSIVDIISFGVAPAVIIYLRWLRFSNSFDIFSWFFSFMFVAAGAYRLARFNVQSRIDVESSLKFFTGLPIPAAAGLLATTLWLHSKYHASAPLLFDYIPRFIPWIMLILTYLMVSKIKFYSLKKLSLRNRKSLIPYIILTLVIILVILQPAITFFIISVTYIMAGLILKVKKNTVPAD